jgi:hypothetical protein
MLIARSQRDCDNAATDKPLKPSLKAVLAESHIAAVAIAVLLVWAIDKGLEGAFYPLMRFSLWLADLAVTASVTGEIPYISTHLTVLDQLIWVPFIWEFLCGLMYFTAACVLSRWVFGGGPFQCLQEYGRQLRRTQG